MILGERVAQLGRRFPDLPTDLVADQLAYVTTGAVQFRLFGGLQEVLVFAADDLELEVVEVAGDVDSKLEWNRRLEDRQVIIEGHVHIVRTTDGHLVAVHLHQEGEDLDLAILDGQVDRDTVDQITLLILEH